MKRTRAIERQPKASVDWKPTSTCPFSELRLQLINPSTSPNELNTMLTPHSILHGDACFAYFNKIWAPPAHPSPTAFGKGKLLTAPKRCLAIRPRRDNEFTA